MNDPLFILDGYGLIYRAYFAFINRPVTDRDGQNVSAVSGFLRTIIVLVRQYGARSILVAFDPIGPTFRHRKYPEYKATRDSAPEDLHAQVPLIEEILDLLGIRSVRIDGFEADDVIGSVARICRERSRPCRMVSADKDLMQLVDDTVLLVRPEKGGGFRTMGIGDVFEDKGVRPDQIVDYLSLIGDSSDNIPGVDGVGPKTAASLLADWNDLDSLYANIEGAATGNRLEKLKAGRENAFFSRELVRIVDNLPVEHLLDPPEAAAGGVETVVRMLLDRDLSTLAADVGKVLGRSAAGVESSLPADGGRPAAGPVSGTEAPAVTTYTAILSDIELDDWALRIRKAGIVALDTETTDIDPLKAELVGVSVSVRAGEAAYIPVKIADGPALGRQKVAAWLNGLLGDGRVKIVGQNFKYDLKVLSRAGVPLKGAWFDTMIAAWVLDASSPVGMDALADRYLNHTTVKFDDVVPKGATFDRVPLEDAVRYAAEDADITFRLYQVFSAMLENDPERAAIFRDMEMPLLPVLARMEIEGIGLDRMSLESYGIELGTAIGEVVRDIYRLCGHEFNIASPKQLQTVLFEERGLPGGKKTKSGFSTDNSVLSDLAHQDPVPERILVYRSLTKLKSTYVDVLPELVHPEDGRVHTSYSQTGAATGRLSSNNPNLQNIPVRDENGRRIRKAFTCAPDRYFVSADYSQIELVILAHMSADPALCAAFREGVDVHARTAALLLGIDPSDVTPEQRRVAKAVNFGVMYGMSAFRLSNELGIGRAEAKHFIDAYFTTYRGIKTFIEEAIDGAERNGGVRTLYGRFRPLPGITSRNRVEKAAAERAAVNSIIQGTAADIMKLAMLKVDEALTRVYPDARLLLQVHDELLVECPVQQVDGISAQMKAVMESVAVLSVPLRASVDTGATWGDIH